MAGWRSPAIPGGPGRSLALYSRKPSSGPTVQRLASFTANAVGRWENDARQAASAESKSFSLTPHRARRPVGMSLGETFD
jgi:hypothetical protein